MRNFPPAFILFFLFFFVFCALASTNCICLPFHPSSFCLLFRLFPYFLYPHRPKDFFFSFFFISCFFFLLHQLRCSILCHETEQTIAKEEEEKKRKKSCRCCCHYDCTHLYRLISSPYVTKKNLTAAIMIQTENKLS